MAVTGLAGFIAELKSIVNRGGSTEDYAQAVKELLENGCIVTGTCPPQGGPLTNGKISVLP